jgi:hypothetical protein
VAELNLRALLTASQAALYTGVTPAAVCNWVSRGYLKPAADRQGRVIKDSRNRPLYRLMDVIAAEGEVARSQRGRPRKSAA